ncbi:MAG: hypothetical protein H6825_12200 [Planctomycetes bacterium]|nr:hypothetical protein [Planctomycetota bacterium]
MSEPMNRALRTTTGALLLGLLAACAASEPEAAVDTPYGTARAAQAGDAERLALMLLDLGPRVRALLPDTLDRPTEVWLDDFAGDVDLDERPGLVGFTTLGQGRIRIRADRLGLDADFVLAHELVHALLGESWAPLPAILKEGLCDTLAARLSPEAGARVRGVRLLSAGHGWAGMQVEISTFEPGLRTRRAEELPFQDADAPPPFDALGVAGAGIHLHDPLEHQDAYYGYGMLVVERIVDRVGFSGLHELCLAAASLGEDSVPPEWLLATAELDHDPRTWRDAILERQGLPELTAVVEQLAEPLAQWVASAYRHRFPGRDASDFLEQALPTLGWRGGRVKAALATAPGFRSALESAWRASGPSVLRPGEGWWIQDHTGVTLTDLRAPSADEPWYTVNRVRIGQPPRSDTLELPADFEPEQVLGVVHLRQRASGLEVSALHPLGLADFRVELDGVVVADLQRGLDVSVTSVDGWTVVSTLLAGRRLDEVELFAPDADLVVSLRARDEDAHEQSFPLRTSRRR